MPLPAILAGIAGAIGAVSEFAHNPLVSYFLVLLVLILDSSVSGILGFQGVVGFLFSSILSALGVHVVIFTWQIAFLIAVAPLVFFVIKKSGHQ